MSSVVRKMLQEPVKKKKKKFSIEWVFKRSEQSFQIQTWGDWKLRCQLHTGSALGPRTCCSPQSCCSNWIYAGTCGTLSPPKCGCRGSVGTGWGPPAPDSRTATALLPAAGPSPLQSSAHRNRVEMSNFKQNTEKHQTLGLLPVFSALLMWFNMWQTGFLYREARENKRTHTSRSLTHLISFIHSVF